jgi:hypothetical protein
VNPDDYHGKPLSSKELKFFRVAHEFPRPHRFSALLAGVWRDCADCKGDRPSENPADFAPEPGFFPRFFASVATHLVRALDTVDGPKSVGARRASSPSRRVGGGCTEPSCMEYDERGRSFAIAPDVFVSDLRTGLNPTRGRRRSPLPRAARRCWIQRGRQARVRLASPRPSRARRGTV